MFLFRRRKEITEIPVDELKLEETEQQEKGIPAAPTIKTVARTAKPPVKDKKEKAANKAEPEKAIKDPYFQSEDSLQIIENDTLVKVVIPASSLIEEDSLETELILEQETPGESVPEEVVDGLFVKVNEGKTIEEQNIPLESILLPLEKKAASSGEKSLPTALPPTQAQPAAGATKEKTSQLVADAKPAPGKLAAALPLDAASIPGSSEPKNANPEAAIDISAAAQSENVATGKTEPVPEPKTLAALADTGKKAGGEDNKENLFSQLFDKLENVEETPLDRLIKALPEISMEELLNESEEVKGLMSEWFQNQLK
jgi:hypothetical protein